MLEYEKKVLLTAKEYGVLFAALGKQKPMKEQINHYFDTDDFSMNKNGITCRIRAKDGKFKATVKSHRVEDPDCSTEEDLYEKTEFDPMVFYAKGLNYQGRLITERVWIYRDNACEAVLDRNTYLGHTDYELELEYRNGTEQCAQQYLDGVANVLLASKTIADADSFLCRVGTGKTKSRRFFDRKQGERT